MSKGLLTIVVWIRIRNIFYGSGSKNEPKYLTFLISPPSHIISHPSSLTPPPSDIRPFTFHPFFLTPRPSPLTSPLYAHLTPCSFTLTPNPTYLIPPHSKKKYLCFCQLCRYSTVIVTEKITQNIFLKIFEKVEDQSPYQHKK